MKKIKSQNLTSLIFWNIKILILYSSFIHWTTITRKPSFWIGNDIKFKYCKTIKIENVYIKKIKISMFKDCYPISEKKITRFLYDIGKILLEY